ncbi:1-deoxy-D-xylulose-5-phosphate reductoisomerase [Pseudorhodoferax sp. Leaf267]|uniref:1-deoxy-D-xylulose-5-phosphate reductoisomerase n=1 Tax=Pseudorhodoferax sp. Leaf267 TaxID=1736316 RepID=UPI0006F43F4E|nr:1-deoxy-D-xylulose-5-phosphate reductoisomerase [Pseudorhodoferax sp. Leaf267]KQP17733.1 1-deoxy-D-xylulose 5-phosphate reductoisomerase [Pseudorhodoferax sp. Leaf267]
MRQALTILGSTGSVGVNTLDVVARHRDRFEVFALTAATQVEPMLRQCAAVRPRYAVMADPQAARLLDQRVQAEGLAVEVLAGPAAIAEMASHPDVHAVMAAIVGAAGLAPCLAAAHAGKRVLLANKEALVVGGDVFLAAVRSGGAMLLPIDSEHSAVFQSLPEDASTWSASIEKIMLTSSGGPFRTRDPATLRDVTPDEACAHPNFAMGRKISVDSATMMNKALEVIEAKYLFGVTPEQIEVVIHPQQIIHSMVQFHDASVMAQLGTPDMRVPIAYGLSWPQRIESGTARLDFSRMAAMTFEAPDPVRFPCLQLAWESLRAPSGTCAVLNAANEVGVAAFLARRIRFDQIHALNLATLEQVQPSKPQSLADLLALDAQVRAVAEQCIARLAGQ